MVQYEKMNLVKYSNKYCNIVLQENMHDFLVECTRTGVYLAKGDLSVGSAVGVNNQLIKLR